MDDRCAFGTMLGWLEHHRGCRLSNEAIEEATVILAQVINEAKRQVYNHYKAQATIRRAIAPVPLVPEEKP